jgi:uncharacterized protein YndB with AHSA1/START domain
MTAPRIISNTITINAPAAKVWGALTQPEFTRVYLFGCAPVTDWQAGSQLDWTGTFDGVEMTPVKGKIVSIEPQKELAYTTFDPFSKIEDVPENYLTVTYLLSEAGSQTLLTVTQGDYNTVAEGDRRFEEASAGGGWQPILEQIKTLAEADAPAK